MKSYNIAVEFNIPDNPANLPALCMLCFSLPDEVDEAEMYATFHEELVSAIIHAKTSNSKLSVAHAVCMAAKIVKDRFGGESFMIEANSSLVIDLH